MTVFDLTELSDAAQSLCQILAKREMQSQITVRLPELADTCGVSLLELHPLISEITAAKIVTMERLGGGNSALGAMCRFRWNADPAEVLNSIPSTCERA